MINYRVRISIYELTHHKYNMANAFKSLVSEIKKRLPYLKLEYGFVNTKDLSNRIQLMLVFSFTGKGGDTNIKKYMIYLANQFSYFSLEGFDICSRNGKLDDWFDDLIDRPVVYPENFVKDMIMDSEGVLPKTSTNPEGRLSWSSKDKDAYWKNPDNALKVAEQLDKYASMYHSIAQRAK